MAEVCVKIEDKNRNIISARKSGEDIVIASVEAMIDAINKMLLKKMLISNSAAEALDN
jgi:2-isopropylmalate synthase